MNGFIQNAACISPFDTFEKNINFEYLPKESIDELGCLDPDFKAFINPKLSRRMSPIIKRSVACAKKLHTENNDNAFDAIIVGTGLGCLKDTVHFIDDITKENEQLVSPTAFIQSTHNTIGGQIALSLEQTSYNMTYSQRGASFSNSLVDSLLLLKENKNNILVGAADELTETSFTLLERIGLYQKKWSSNEAIYSVKNQKTLAGEGIAFFHLTNQKTAVEIVSVLNRRTLEVNKIQTVLHDFLANQNLKLSDLRFILTGENAEEKSGSFYRELQTEKTAVLNFKHLSGEFHTADAIGLWYAYEMMKQNQTPKFLNLKSAEIDNSKKYALIYTNFFGQDHSFVLIKKHD